MQYINEWQGNHLKITKSFEADGDINKAYQAVNEFYMQRGYRAVSTNPPISLSLERGHVVGSVIGLKTEDIRTKLMVGLAQVGNRIHIKCDYDIETVVGVVVGWGVRAGQEHSQNLETEIELLKSHLIHIQPQPQSTFPPSQPLPPPPPPPSKTCPTCGQPLSYIEQYKAWYCYNCKKYV